LGEYGMREDYDSQKQREYRDALLHEFTF